jgi:hypothetical protein
LPEEKEDEAICCGGFEVLFKPNNEVPSSKNLRNPRAQRPQHKHTKDCKH